MESEHYPLMITVKQIREMSDAELDYWLDTLAAETVALTDMYERSEDLVDTFFAEWLKKHGESLKNGD